LMLIEDGFFSDSILVFKSKRANLNHNCT